MAMDLAIKFLKSANSDSNITSFMQCVAKLMFFKNRKKFCFKLFKGTIFNHQQADLKGVAGNKYHLLGPPQSHPQGQL